MVEVISELKCFKKNDLCRLADEKTVMSLSDCKKYSRPSDYIGLDNLFIFVLIEMDDYQYAAYDITNIIDVMNEAKQIFANHPEDKRKLIQFCTGDDDLDKHILTKNGDKYIYYESSSSACSMFPDDRDINWLINKELYNDIITDFISFSFMKALTQNQFMLPSFINLIFIKDKTMVNQKRYDFLKCDQPINTLILGVREDLSKNRHLFDSVVFKIEREDEGIAGINFCTDKDYMTLIDKSIMKEVLLFVILSSILFSQISDDCKLVIDKIR